MNKLIQRLKDFNAKERYFLIRQVLGIPEFAIGQQFRKALVTVGITIPEEAKTYWAMDYHLDWLYAALHPSPDGSPQSNEQGIIQANQEDVDFLIAYEAEGITHIVLLEAKAFTGWTNSQLDSKKKRLEKMFTPEILAQGVQPHFVLISPKESDGLKTEGYPDWMCPGRKFLWLRLQLGSGFVKVARCGPDGKANKEGENWKVERRAKGCVEDGEC
jgi:hypothetical protein